jgi:Tol biopolymer transport system component/tRNA A-37 threonylcarbamoyl transferase component Bud32
MGDVYRARDTKLHRDIALKIVSDRFVADSDRLTRFQREAQILASLNHPNIAQIYGLEEQGALRALVMELVDGRTLAEVLTSKPGGLPIVDAVNIARQIAEALESAHERGVIHRDLKPGNVMLTGDDERVKVLDFGLARATDPVPGPGAADSPTVTSPALTQAGLVLGTAAYMSPEQAKGRTADKRSDVWSFGCVLYEMVTGTPPFAGENVADTLAAVLTRDPDWSRVPVSTPRSVRVCLERCLLRDRHERISDFSTVRFLLADIVRLDHSTGGTAPSASSRRWFVGAALTVLLAVVGAAIWAGWPAPTGAPEAIRFQVLPPTDSAFSVYVALSPDGRHLAFTATGADAIVRLWIRDLDEVEARVLPGTEGAQSIIWSPDSRRIAFGFSNQLKKIDIAGGPPELVCEAESPVGSGAWGPDDIILFGSRGGAGGISRVSASGGAVTPLTFREGGTSSFPSLLPGRRFLYYRRGAVEGIFAGSIDAAPEQQPTTAVLPSAHAAAYVRPIDANGGYLFFVRDQTLMVQPFNEQTLKLSGDAMPIGRIATVNAYAAFSASSNGRLAYRSGGRSTSRQLTWFDRDGRRLGTAGDPGSHEQIALSPDGMRAAYRDDDGAVAGDLWLADLTRGVSERLTTERSLGGFPVWSPDGTRLAYRVVNDVVEKRATGVGDLEVLLRSPIQTTPTSWSRDGRFILLTTIGPSNTLLDIDILPMQGDRRSVSFIRTQYNESQATFSPDGHWVAYTSNESGRNEVYVRSFTPPGSPASSTVARARISRDGGNSPVWRDDGRELIFRSASGAPMAAEVIHTSTSFHAGSPTLLFETPAVPWDVTPDGQRFLVSMPPPTELPTPITIDLNWESTLKR